MFIIPCSKCEGKGRVTQSFSNVIGGVCFGCKGRGNFAVSKEQYFEYIKAEKTRLEGEEKRKQDELRSKLESRASLIKKNIEIITDIEKMGGDNKEAMSVYNNLSFQVREDLYKYTLYKMTYKQKIGEIESILEKWEVSI